MKEKPDLLDMYLKLSDHSKHDKKVIGYADYF